MNGSSPLPDGPYKGLASFDDSELDERFFFGRDRETEIVASNLVASRLTVLYGPSGVGKSSLLRAGVVRRLRALVPAGGEAGEGSGPLPVVVDQWRDDPLAAIAVAAGTPVPESPQELADVLAERSAQVGGEIYLVLDQMEEYFVYHGRDRGGPLREALAEILARPTLPRAHPARHSGRRPGGPRRLQGTRAGAVRQRPPPRPPRRRCRPCGDPGAARRARGHGRAACDRGGRTGGCGRRPGRLGENRTAARRPRRRRRRRTPRARRSAVPPARDGADLGGRALAWRLRSDSGNARRAGRRGPNRPAAPRACARESRRPRARARRVVCSISS